MQVCVCVSSTQGNAVKLPIKIYMWSKTVAPRQGIISGDWAISNLSGRARGLKTWIFVPASPEPRFFICKVALYTLPFLITMKIKHCETSTSRGGVTTFGLSHKKPGLLMDCREEQVGFWEAGTDS